MVAVHVLGDDDHVRLLLQIHQGVMGGVGRAVGDQPAAPVVPAPDQLGVGMEGPGGGQLLGPVVAPQGVLAAAEGGDAAGGGDAGAAQDGYLGIGADGLAVVFQVHVLVSLRGSS